MSRIITLMIVAAIATGASALDFIPREITFYGGGGKSVTTWHGQASFRSVQFELTGDSPFVQRWVPKATVGASICYHDIRQARSWFGYRDGDPNDSVRAESAYFFIRRGWREGKGVEPYIEIGSGPMWSNRRVPAATSRFNFDSQLGLGTRMFARKHPLYLVVRFSHISNVALASRNPGVNVTSLLLGTRIRKLF